MSRCGLVDFACGERCSSTETDDIRVKYIIEGDVMGVMDRPTGEGEELDSERQKWYTTTYSEKKYQTQKIEPLQKIYVCISEENPL